MMGGGGVEFHRGRSRFTRIRNRRDAIEGGLMVADLGFNQRCVNL